MNFKLLVRLPKSYLIIPIFVKIDTVEVILYLRALMKFCPYFLIILSDFDEILYKISPFKTG